MHNRPLIFFDAYGLSAEQINEGSNGLWSRGWNQVGGALKNIYYSPRFQGAMQAFGGLVETGVGAGMTYTTGGFAGPLGWPVMAHGLDHCVTGMNTVWSGIPRDTVTSQLLQQAGMSPETAGLVDNGISIGGTMGGAAFKIYGGNNAASTGRNSSCGSISRMQPTKANSTRGWKVGQPINNLIREGNVPSWSTVRNRYWKNRAHELKSNPNQVCEYANESNIKRMERELAPQRKELKTGRLESRELHHTPPQRDGGLFDVTEVWPDEHAIRDKFRFTGG